MADKDKLILVFYINVDNIDKYDWSDYLHDAKESLTANLDDSVISYFVPIEGENSKIDCINPQLLGDEEYEINIEKLKKVIEKFNEILDNLTNNNFDNE